MTTSVDGANLPDGNSELHETWLMPLVTEPTLHLHSLYFKRTEKTALTYHDETTPVGSTPCDIKGENLQKLGKQGANRARSRQ